MTPEYFEGLTGVYYTELQDAIFTIQRSAIGITPQNTFEWVYYVETERYKKRGFVLRDQMIALKAERIGDL